MRARLLRFAIVFARVAVAAGFLSSVADRFGAWGKAGAPGVIWGDFQRFLVQTEALVPYLPHGVLTPLAWFVTVLESAIGLALLVGLRTRTMAWGAAWLLLAFAIVLGSQSVAGLHGVLASSVLAAAGACMLLATTADEI